MSWKRWSAFVVASLLAVGCAQSDPGITTAVKSKLAADDMVKAYRIDVDTKDRVVTLTGAVDTPQARDRAVQIARDTSGVRDVTVQLVVSPGATPTTGIDDPMQEKASEAGRKAGEAVGRSQSVATDAALTAAVKSKFLADTGVSGLRIDVDTANGVVTLTGTVPSSAERQKAVALAKDTDGVKSVVDNLKVGR